MITMGAETATAMSIYGLKQAFWRVRQLLDDVVTEQNFPLQCSSRASRGEYKD